MSHRTNNRALVSENELFQFGEHIGEASLLIVVFNANWNENTPVCILKLPESVDHKGPNMDRIK